MAEVEAKAMEAKEKEEVGAQMRPVTLTIDGIAVVEASKAAERMASTGQEKLDAMIAKVQKLIIAMSPHRLEEPLQDSLGETVAFLKRELEVAEQGGSSDVLMQAADAVVADLVLIPFPTVQASNTKLNALICAGLHRRGGSGVVEDGLVPLKTQLQCVQDVLQVYAHTTLSFCSLPDLQENEAAVLGALSEMLVKPAVEHVKEAVRSMCERMEGDLPYFQKQVTGKGAEEKAIYENVSKIYTGDSADRLQRDAYDKVSAQIDQMKKELQDSGRSGTVQSVSDVLQLAVQFRACSPTFSDLVSMIADDMPGVELKQRKGLKALYRMIEKGLLKGPGAKDWKATLFPGMPVDCSKILDGVGCIFLCQTFIDMNLLVEKMRSVVATLDDVHFCRIKNRWKEPTDGGWRDIMFNLIVANVVVEVQIAHAELYYARKKWGHSSYGDVRCFQEVLAFTGNEEKLSEEPDQSRNPTYDVIFSHKTDQNGFVKELIDRMPDLRCFSQTDLDQTQSSWKLQWLEAYESAKVCVCVLTKEYLLSGPCCLEWNTATVNSETRVVLAFDSPDDILASVNEAGSRCEENVDIYLYLRNGSSCLLKTGKTVQEMCTEIKRKIPKSQNHTALSKRVSASMHLAVNAASTIFTVASDEPAVDVLVIVDYPTHGGGGGAIEPAKYIAPLQALKAAMDAKFVGTQARIRFHTPRSVVEDDPDLLAQRIPCLCWIGMGEEAPAVEGSVFTTSLWKGNGGGCGFAIVLLKHGAESTSGKLLDDGCADRVLWVSADYTDTQKTNEFLADGKSYTAAIPEVLHIVLTGAAFNTDRAAKKCCSLALDLAGKRSIDAGIRVTETARELLQVAKGDERLADDVGISLSRTPSDPAWLRNTMVGVPHHSSVDLNQWPQACELLQTLNKGRNALTVVTVTGGTDFERRAVAWTAVQSYIAVAGRFMLVVYRDADLPVSSRQSPETFDLPFDTHGDQDVLVWIDSRTEFPLETLREAIESSVEDKSVPFPWTFILTSQSDFDDVADAFEDASEIQLQEAIGTTVNESSEDLIRIVPADPTLKLQSILEVVTAAELLSLLATALPQMTDGTPAKRGVKDYIDQILVGESSSVVVRGMAPNTKFLFELRNDLADGSLDQRINKLLRGFVSDASDLGGQVWTLDKSAFVSIYPKILSQMDQLSPRQREKLQECEAVQRVHVTGPAGCGKTFIALHMVIDMIEAAELSSGALSRESPILFVGKNEALCRFFVNWILDRLRKTHKTKAVKALMSACIKVLHTSPFEGEVFALEFGSSGNIAFVKEKVSPNHSLVIVDEAHHIFAITSDAGDNAWLTGACTAAIRSVLLSDISQCGTAALADLSFPPDYVEVRLTEVVRNSNRILTASLPFCRIEDLDDVQCQHGVRGPPLVPFLFDHCGDDEEARFKHYVQGVVNSLQNIFTACAGMDIHDSLAILVPNAEFKCDIEPLLRAALDAKFPESQFSIVNAVEGAFPRKRKVNECSRIVLDTLDSFDGMERLFVMAVGLDSVRTPAGCCNIYRAITRAHMFVYVVQEHLKGGWLEFTATVKRDDSADYDAAEERDRVVRDNLTIIAGSEMETTLDKFSLVPDVGVGAGATEAAVALKLQRQAFRSYEVLVNAANEIASLLDRLGKMQIGTVHVSPKQVYKLVKRQNVLEDLKSKKEKEIRRDVPTSLWAYIHEIEALIVSLNASCEQLMGTGNSTSVNRMIADCKVMELEAIALRHQCAVNNFGPEPAVSTSGSTATFPVAVSGKDEGEKVDVSDLTVLDEHDEEEEDRKEEGVVEHQSILNNIWDANSNAPAFHTPVCNLVFNPAQYSQSNLTGALAKLESELQETATVSSSVPQGSQWQCFDDESGNWAYFSPESNAIIVDAKQKGDTLCRLIVNGEEHVLDLELCIQYPRTNIRDQSRLRYLDKDGYVYDGTFVDTDDIVGTNALWQWHYNDGNRTGWVDYDQDLSDRLSAAKLNGEAKLRYTNLNGNEYEIKLLTSDGKPRQMRCGDARCLGDAMEQRFVRPPKVQPSGLSALQKDHAFLTDPPGYHFNDGERATSKYAYSAGGVEELDLKAGEEVKIISAPAHKPWWKVENGSGNQGFVQKDYLEVHRTDFGIGQMPPPLSPPTMPNAHLHEG